MRDRSVVLERLRNRPRLHVIGGMAWRIDSNWFRSRLRAAAVVSLAIHVSLFGAFVIRYPRRSRPDIHFTSIPVDLVRLRSPGSIAGRQSGDATLRSRLKTKPEVKKPPKPQIKPKGKLAPPAVKNARPVPSRKVGRTAEAARDSAAARPVLREELPLAGGAQGALEMSVDGPISAYAYYLMTVRDKVASHWEPPAGIVPQGKEIAAMVNFRINRSGKVTASYVEEPSGTGVFDSSGLRAIAESDPLPPLPQEYPGDWLGIHIRFVYNE